jgi:hypothetical protein
LFTIDTYIYDPSIYYGDEGESPTSTEGQIRFEFGAPASAPQSHGGAASLAAAANMAAMNSSAPAQMTKSEDPVQDINTQAKWWIGMSVTILIVTVRIEALRPFYKA